MPLWYLIKQIVDVESLDEANALLAQGWILIDTYKKDGIVHYVLGKKGEE
jgi:hypothetical protein